MDPLNIDGPNMLPSAIAPPPSNGGLPPVLTNPLNLPPAGPPPVLPGGMAPQVTHDPTRLESDQAKLHDLQDNGSGVQQFQGRHPVIGGIIHGLDTAAKILAPRIEPLIPGSEGNHQQQIGQAQGVVNQDQSDLQDAAKLEDTQSQSQVRQAGAAKNEAIALEDTPVPVDPAVAQQIGMPELSGIPLTPAHLRQLIAGKHNNDAKITQTGMNNATSTANTAANNETRKAVATGNNQTSQANNAANNQTKVKVKGMGDATSAANTAARIAGGTGKAGTQPGNFKVPMDVTKRAALADNVNENAGKALDLINRRPDMLGAGGGRFTNVQQMIGSDDPDIQELGTRIHNMALAANGAHGLRSAEAVHGTEQQLLNSFHSGPHAVAAAIKATQDSVQTFLEDEKNFRQTGGRVAPPSGGQVFARDPQGKLHAAPAGSQIPQGWTIEKGQQ